AGDPLRPAPARRAPPARGGRRGVGRLADAGPGSVPPPGIRGPRGAPAEPRRGGARHPMGTTATADGAHCKALGRARARPGFDTGQRLSVAAGPLAVGPWPLAAT